MSNRVKLRRAARVLHAAGQDQDADFFNSHEHTNEYVRPATSDELRTAGLPPGTQVRVLLHGDRRIRMFESPTVRQN